MPKNRKNNTQGQTILWWGRSDREYSRNRLVLSLLKDLGWGVDFFHPASSPLGLIESFFRRPRKPDMIWVPCFRQSDVASAAHWADKWDIPLLIDPLISAYQKEVYERGKWPPGSPKAEQRKKSESRLFRLADIVIADTPAHADYFRDELNVEPHKLSVLYVSAEDEHFTATPLPKIRNYIEVLFYGSFLPLQGIETIIQAAQLIQDKAIRWTLLGQGDLLGEMKDMAQGANNIFFEPWIDYAKLPERVAQAHILLGIFGTTMKAGLVIPNKMFQAMAAGRPVITMESGAYRETLAGSDVIGWVPPGNPEALAKIVRQWLHDVESLEQRGHETRKLFETHFSRNKTKVRLKEILDHAHNITRRCP